jgi:hypothetical protein
MECLCHRNMKIIGKGLENIPAMAMVLFFEKL